MRFQIKLIVGIYKITPRYMNVEIGNEATQFIFGNNCFEFRHSAEVLSVILIAVALQRIPQGTLPGPEPDIEVTEIILAKVSRLCQLSSHRRGFLSDLSCLNLGKLWKIYSLAYGFDSL
jgi:hypothetical protein